MRWRATLIEGAAAAGGGAVVRAVWVGFAAKVAALAAADVDGAAVAMRAQRLLLLVDHYADQGAGGAAQHEGEAGEGGELHRDALAALDGAVSVGRGGWIGRAGKVQDHTYRQMLRWVCENRSAWVEGELMLLEEITCCGLGGEQEGILMLDCIAPLEAPRRLYIGMKLVFATTSPETSPADGRWWPPSLSANCQR